MKGIKCLLSQSHSTSLLLAGIVAAYGLAARAAVPEPAGWYAGDMHVHRSCGTPPEAVSTIYDAMVTQDLSVVSLLADMGNGEVQDQTTDLPLVTGQNDPAAPAGRILHWDAEWHWDPDAANPQKALSGHVVALGLTRAQQMWREYSYPIFEWAHQQGAIAGFVHLQYMPEGIPQTLNCCIPLEFPVEVALGTCDFIAEDVTGSSSALTAYYRLLNCGFRPGFAAGSDHPCGSSIGPMLTYAQVAGGQFTYRNWIQGIANGRTVVSRSGHTEFIELKVNGNATPGDVVPLSAAGSVPVTVQWTANQNLSGTIELVCNGVVVASQQGSAAPGAPVTLTTTVNFTDSGWLCARRMSGGEHQLHTAAVFVTVKGAPVRASAADAQFFVQWLDNLLQKTSPGGAWSSFFSNENDRGAAQGRYTSARSVYQQIATEAAAKGAPLPVLGNATEGSSSDPIWDTNSWINACRFQATSNTAVAAIHAKVAGITGSYKCAIYADNGGIPGALLGSTAPVTAPGEGWSTFQLPSPVTVTSGASYWLAIWSDNANARVYYSDTSGTLVSSPYPYGEWPNPLTITSSGNLNYCIYATGATPVSVLAVATTSLPNGVSNQVYSATLAAEGGNPPYTWSLASGSLPGGLALNATSGAITGTPANTGTFSFTVQVSDASSPVQTATRPLSIKVTQFPVVAFVNGTYNGLCYEPTGAVHESSGYLTVSTTRKGTFSGKVSIGGKRHSFRGSLDASGHSSVTVQRRDKSALALRLQLEGTNTLTGTVGDGNWLAPLHADRYTFTGTNSCASDYAGLHTFMIPGNTNAAVRPGGDSFGTFKVTSRGRVNLAGSLADGAKITQGTFLAEDGSLPLFASLYRNTGLLIGWLESPPNTTATLEKVAVWIKSNKSAATTRHYPVEFSDEVTVYSTKYTPPGKQPVFGFTNGTVVLMGGNLAAPLTNSFRLLANNKVEVVAPAPANLRLKLNTASGKFSGSFSIPPSKKSYKFQGVLMRQMNEGYGYFLGTNQSGCVRIGPAGSGEYRTRRLVLEAWDRLRQP